MDAMPDHLIRDEAALTALYGEPSAGAVAKEVDHIHPHYRAMIEASPFVVLATSGPGGLDVSPRGDPAGFVTVADEKTLLIPDRRGNNRVDSLRNIVHDPRVALLFLIPGVGETLRVNGRAAISVAPELLARFVFRDALPRSVIVVQVETVYFQCPKALVRSELWNPEKHIRASRCPAPGRSWRTSPRAGSGASSTTGSIRNACARRCTRSPRFGIADQKGGGERRCSYHVVAGAGPPSTTAAGGSRRVGVVLLRVSCSQPGVGGPAPATTWFACGSPIRERCTRQG